MKALLVLEDGRSFEGEAFGAAGTSMGGVVASVLGASAAGVWADVAATRLRAKAPGMNLRIIWYLGRAGRLVSVFPPVQNRF